MAKPFYLKKEQWFYACRNGYEVPKCLTAGNSNNCNYNLLTLIYNRRQLGSATLDLDEFSS